MSVDLPLWKDLKNYEKRSKKRLHNLLSELSPDIPEWSKLNPLIRSSKRKRYDLYATVLGLKHYRSLPRNLVRSTRQYWDYVVNNVDPGPPGPVDVTVEFYEKNTDNPVPNAHVYFDNEIHAYDGVTDENGKVTIPNVEPGDGYRFDCTADNFEHFETDRIYEIGRGYDRFRFPMVKINPLTIKVYDEDTNEPISMARIVLGSGETESTDMNGYAYFKGLEDGFYTGTVTVSPYISEDLSMGYYHKTSYEFNVPMQKRADPGTLTATIKCVKMDSSGGIANCDVYFDSITGQFIGATDNEGNLLVEHLDYKQYTFAANNNDDPDYTRKASKTVTITKNKQTIVIPFRRD